MADESKIDRIRRADTIVKVAFARVGVIGLAVASGGLGATVLAIATAWLVLRGAPPGVQLGPHLALLGEILPGYTVSWSGSVVGFFYGFLIGFCSGAALGFCWNIIHYAYMLALVGRDHVGAREL
jgi:hypothetical protein